MYVLARTRPPAHPKRLLPTANQSLAKHNRKSSQIFENNHHEPKSIASFCRVFCAYAGRPLTHPQLAALTRAPAALSPLSLSYTHHYDFLVARRQLIEINPTPSQQRRKHFLFDTNERFFRHLYRIEMSASPSRHSTDCLISLAAADDAFAPQKSPAALARGGFAPRMIIYLCVCCSWIPLLERSARDSIRDAKTALVNPFLAVIQ